MKKMYNILENALLYAPEGLRLWSDVDGVVELDRYHNREWLNEDYPFGRICVNALDVDADFADDYNLYGQYGCEGKGNCVLWPSKDHRTWDNWQRVLFRKGNRIYDTERKVVFVLTYMADYCQNLNDGVNYYGDLSNGKHTTGFLKDCRFASKEQIAQYEKEVKVVAEEVRISEVADGLIEIYSMNSSMNCSDIFQIVFREYREVYDCYVRDIIVWEIAEDYVKAICKKLGIEYVRSYWP